MGWTKDYGARRFKALDPTDLGLNAQGVHSTFPTGNFFEIGPYDRFQLSAICVVAGGDRTAGTVKFTLELYDSSESGTLLASFDLATGLQRFGAGTTKKATYGFGGTLAGNAVGDGSPAVAATATLLRSAAVGRLVLAQDAAYSGGSTNPTTALLSAWLFMS